MKLNEKNNNLSQEDAYGEARQDLIQVDKVTSWRILHLRLEWD
jgi:hypothetical protein